MLEVNFIYRAEKCLNICPFSNKMKTLGEEDDRQY